MLEERKIEIGLLRIAATLCAVIAWACVIVNFVEPGDDLGFVGVIFIACWGVLRIRGFFCQQASRERAAFDIGREHANVRSLN